MRLESCLRPYTNVICADSATRAIVAGLRRSVSRGAPLDYTRWSVTCRSFRTGCTGSEVFWSPRGILTYTLSTFTETRRSCRNSQQLTRQAVSPVFRQHTADVYLFCPMTVNLGIALQIAEVAKEVSLNRLYAAKRGNRPLIRAGCGVCQSTPQWSRRRSR